MHFPTDRIAQTMAFVKPVMEPVVDVSGYTFPLNLAGRSIWYGADIEIKNPMPPPRLDVSTYEPQVQ